MDREARFNRADRVSRVSLAANVVLMTGKLGAGYFGGSAAVIADGVESAADLLAVALSMAAVRIGRRPFDVRHPYGHGRAEHLAALIVSLLIVLFGAGILWDALRRLSSGDLPSPTMLAAGAAAATIVAKECLYRYTDRAARELGSPAVGAMAEDHRKDAVTSVATLIGVIGALAGFRWADPAAALVTALLIFRIGYQMFTSAAYDIMDGTPGPELLAAMTAAAEEVSGVEHVHEIRARRSGQYFIVDLKLEMDPEMTVRESHQVADAVKRRLFELFQEVGDVMIHINPHDQEHTDLIRL
ncbi:MAG TPA: cation diffusion facilitator family transporter [Verrucomicrobiae bacterium]|nr:cation diffusion facilitator family transporter [Verrucomicrobiae bacterium]